MTAFTYYEPLEAGHCTFWAQLVLGAALRDSRISSLSLVACPELIERLDGFLESNSIEVELIPPFEIEKMRQASLFARGKAQWEGVRAMVSKRGGVLFMPFLDHAIYGAILDFKPLNGRVSGVVFRPPNNYGYETNFNALLSSFRRWISYCAAKNTRLDRLFSLDEGACNARLSRVARLLEYLPDPTPDLSLLNQCAHRKRVDGRQLYLLFGALEERKGIYTVLESVGHMPKSIQKTVALRFVGKVSEIDKKRFFGELNMVRDSHPNIVIEVENGFISEMQLAQEVMDCDVVLAPYQNHIGSSGIIHWAAAAGKPVISQNTGLMGYQVKRYNLGNVVDSTNPIAIARAFSDIKPISKDVRFIESHSPDLFARTVLNGMLA